MALMRAFLEKPWEQNSTGIDLKESRVEQTMGFDIDSFPRSFVMMGGMKGLWGQGTGFVFLKSSNGIFVCW